MNVLLIILAIAVVFGCGLWIYSSKVLTPAFEAEKNKTKELVRDILPGVRIHAINSPRHVHLTFEGSEYTIYGPHWKDFEDGGPKTSVFRIEANRHVKCVWQRLHADTKELNAQHLRDALEVVRKGTPQTTDAQSPVTV
jgi:hypothetical protein